MNHVERAAKAQIDAEAHGVGIVLQRDFGHVQRELVGLNVEVTEVVKTADRVAGIVAVVSIYQATEGDRPHRPFRGRRGSRRGGWLRSRLRVGRFILCHAESRRQDRKRSGTDILSITHSHKSPREIELNELLTSWRIQCATNGTSRCAEIRSVTLDRSFLRW